MNSSNLASHNSNKVNTRLSLINNLLDYPEQVTRILQENEDIINYSLIQLLENISEYMKIQNQMDTANFLITVTRKIRQYLNYQTNVISHN